MTSDDTALQHVLTLMLDRHDGVVYFLLGSDVRGFETQATKESRLQKLLLSI